MEGGAYAVFPFETIMGSDEDQSTPLITAEPYHCSEQGATIFWQADVSAQHATFLEGACQLSAFRPQ